MKFTVERKVMFELLKSMIRIVPQQGPIPELQGFLIEADENDGCLYLTATNLECAIQRKYKTPVETGGGIVLKADLLLNIVELLSGENIEFEKIRNGQVTIKCGSTVYTLPGYKAKAYPKPEIPFPEDTIKVSGWKELYGRTRPAVGKNENKPALAGIHMEITAKGLRMSGCDLLRLSVAEKKMEVNGKTMSATLPRTSLSYLISAVGDDDTLEVGRCGSNFVFMKSGMLFSTRIISGEYINVDQLIHMVKSDYMAKVDYQEFRSMIQTVSTAAKLGTHTSLIKMELMEDQIKLSTENDVSSGSSNAKAVVLKRTQDRTFYYSARMLLDAQKIVSGDLIILASETGYLLVIDSCGQYMLTPRREPKPVKQKTNPKKNKTKKEAA